MKQSNAKFKSLDPTYSYCARNFEISIQACGETTSNNPSLLARLRNALVHLINKNTTTMLPKIILIVLEDDIIKDAKAEEPNMGRDYNRRIRWLINEYRKIIDTIKDYIAPNARKEGYPYFIWINPSKHINYKNNSARKKFGSCLESSTKSYENNLALRLVQVWDPNDSNAYLGPEQRFSAGGILDFWEGVDKTVEYFETKRVDRTSAISSLPESTNRVSDSARKESNERRSAEYRPPSSAARDQPHHNRTDRTDRERDRRDRYQDNKRPLPPPPGYKRY